MPQIPQTALAVAGSLPCHKTSALGHLHLPKLEEAKTDYLLLIETLN